MSISSQLLEIKTNLPANVKLVAVSKFHPVEAIQEAYTAGQRVFGESRMQEFTAKYPNLPEDIEWHFIGHLQTNKVKAIVPFIHTIHSVDSWKLLTEIEKQASSIKREIKCLLEIHIAKEESKYGLTLEECHKLLDNNNLGLLKHTKIIGLMGMATYTNDTETIRNEFKLLKKIFNEIKNDYFEEKDYFSEISMGMSHDYKIAVEEGSTMVRIGSSIFGDRT